MGKKLKTSMKWFIILFVLSFVWVKTSVAVEHQHCVSGTTCVIGEFLYDDNYVPMTDASCKLTSKYPDGSTFLNQVSLTAGSDGWYSYTLDLTSHPDGLYPSQICCDTSEVPSQHMCLDKTFLAAPATLSSSQVSNAVWDSSTASHTTSGTFGSNLQNAVSTPAQIWSYSSRTLTSFGSLVGDIWSYTGRSLDGFGTLVTDIWSNSTRTLSGAALSGGGQLALKSETETAISNSTSSVKGVSNKDLTQLSTQVAGVQTTADSISTKVDTLQTSVNTINTNVNTLVTKWGVYSASDIITSLGTVTTRLGTDSDTCSSTTVFGNIKCVRDKWGSQTADALYTAANNAYTTASALESELNYNGKSSTAYDDIQALKTSLSSVGTSIGSSSDSSATATLFGRIKKNNEAVAGVQTTVDSISTKVDTLQTSVNTIDTNVNTLITKWGAYSISDVMTQLSTVTTRLGTTSDTCVGNNTVFGNIQCVRDKWGSQTADSLYTAANNAYTTSAALRAELDYNGKSTTAYQDLQTIKGSMSSISGSVGTSSDSSSTATLFGRIKKVQDTVEALDTSGVDVSALLAKWGSYSASDIFDKVKDISSQISNIDTTSNVSSILSIVQSSSSDASDLKDLKNSVLQLKAVIDITRQLVEKESDRPIVQTWLENGSVIFKTLVTNPSTSISQTVPVKFYLPREATQTDVIKMDKGLTLTYDPTSSSSYVSTNVTLLPNETRIFSIEVKDIWNYSDSQLSSMRSQTNELFAPLKNTSYFAQGATLQSDIIASLDTIDRLQKEASTPDQRIQAYRESTVEFTKANSELKDLKALVSSASSVGTMFGFVGGVQTASTWGIILIVIAGFVFLAIFMRKLSTERARRAPQTAEAPQQVVHVPDHAALQIKKPLHKNRAVQLAAVFLASVSITVLSAKLLITHSSNLSLHSSKKIAPVVSKTVAEQKGEATPSAQTADNKQVLGASTTDKTVKVVIPKEFTGINIREVPNVTGTLLERIREDTVFTEYADINGWVEVGLDVTMKGKNYTRGWVYKEYVQE